MLHDRRAFLAAAAAASMIRPTPALAQAVHRPEDFGARGDGATNDSDAFMALGARINAMGGGTIVLSEGKTYVVGRQRPGAARPFAPQPLLDFRGTTRPLTILGNGARLRTAGGLRFGAFDPRSGQPAHRPAPNFHEPDRASPYVGMIVVRGARAPVAIRDVELDGNAVGLRIGGRWGDIGWQVPGSGLLLTDNLAAEAVDNVHSHDHPLDGAMIDGDPRRAARSRFTRLVCRSNGRQGLSIVGGRGYDFTDCEFGRSGRSIVASSPSAGVDIEAEGAKTVRDLSFTRCRFVDNKGVGLLADSGDSAGARFTDCQFVGTTAWGAWPRKPGLVFEGCTFAGASVNPYPSKDPSLAAKFFNCRFTDDPALAAGRQLYFTQAEGSPIVDLGTSDNVLFAGCRFELERQGVLPWSWKAIYRDCVMRQRSRAAAYTKGRYVGRSVIDGPVDLYGSMIEGIVILNGKPVPRGPVGTDFAPW